MKKDTKNICITEKNAYITGAIVSLVFAIIVAYIGAYIMIEAGLSGSKINVFSLGTFLIPILFVLFGMNILVFITCSKKDRK